MFHRIDHARETVVLPVPVHLPVHVLPHSAVVLLAPAVPTVYVTVLDNMMAVEDLEEIHSFLTQVQHRRGDHEKPGEIGKK